MHCYAMCMFCMPRSMLVTVFWHAELSDQFSCMCQSKGVVFIKNGKACCWLSWALLLAV